MTKRILLLGVQQSALDDARQQLQLPDVELLAGHGVDDVRAAFAHADLDHIFLGGGLDLETRLAVVREIFESSDHATVHFKDHLSGPEALVPFVRSVLVGLKDYAPPASPRVPIQARHPWLGTGN